MAHSFELTMLKYSIFASWLIGLFCLSGCGGSNQGPAGPTDMSMKDRFGELSELLSTAQIDLQRPAKKLDDLKKYRLGGPFAFKAISDGEIVMIWGAPLGQGNAVVAHEKNAATAGGWVLLQDRTFKSMTAEEFKAAPKAVGT